MKQLFQRPNFTFSVVTMLRGERDGGREVEGPEYLKSVGACPTFPPLRQNFYEEGVWDEARTHEACISPSFYIALKSRREPGARRYLASGRRMHPSFLLN